VTVRFVEEAQREFLDAISEYEEARAGLGRRFKEEVDRCVLWIAAHPELYRLRPVSYRRINLRVFPYYIPYVVREQTLWILAIAHASRRPLYWVSRRKGVA
jgi:plasmid stabilization system protein ParE